MKNSKHGYFWIVAACCGMSAASLGICVNADGVFYTPVSSALSVGRGTIAMYATFSGLAMGILSPVSIKLLGRIKLNTLIFFGVFLTAGSTMAMAFADQIWMFYLLGTLRGAGCSCFSLAIVTVVIGNWFDRWQATITGIAMSFSGLAGAIFSPVFSSIINLFGYQTAYVFSAIIILILALPSVILGLKLYPGEIGIVPYGNIKTVEPKMNLSQSAGIVQTGHVKTIKLTFFSPVYLIIGFVSFISFLVIGIASHLPGYSESIGMGSVIGATMLSMVMLGNIIFKFVMGYLCDRFGVFRSVLALLVLFICATAGFLIQANNTAILMLASFLFGSIYSIGNIGMSALVRMIYGNKQYGPAYAVITTLLSFSGAISISMVGFIYDAFNSYTSAFSGAIIIGIVCFVLLIVLRHLYNRDTGTKRTSCAGG